MKTILRDLLVGTIASIIGGYILFNLTGWLDSGAGIGFVDVSFRVEVFDDTRIERVRIRNSGKYAFEPLEFKDLGTGDVMMAGVSVNQERGKLLPVDGNTMWRGVLDAGADCEFIIVRTGGEIVKEWAEQFSGKYGVVGEGGRVESRPLTVRLESEAQVARLWWYGKMVLAVAGILILVAFAIFFVRKTQKSSSEPDDKQGQTP